MKSIIRFFLTSSLILGLLSCSEVKKQVAIDDLEGKYFGLAQFAFEWSKLNIGLEDQVVENTAKDVILIYKDAGEKLILDLGQGLKVKINNINLAINGSTFNIPSQEIMVIYDGTEFTGMISGLNECFQGESRCDGFYDSKSGKLSFSFSGTLNFIQEGIEYNVPIVGKYSEYSKITL